MLLPTDWRTVGLSGAAVIHVPEMLPHERMTASTGRATTSEEFADDR
ncbi:MAG: hypothetical protein JKY41_14365 [Rhodobacteraceae bacterium]|nr:hypothetical protein [Paracoccaceae bacterium]